MSLHFNDILTFTISPAVSALSLAAAHWFPWHGGARQLRRTTAYAIGTTGAVAVREQRRFVGCELNPDYMALAQDRIGAAAAQLHLFSPEAI